MGLFWRRYFFLLAVKRLCRKLVRYLSPQIAPCYNSTQQRPSLSHNRKMAHTKKRQEKEERRAGEKAGNDQGTGKNGWVGEGSREGEREV